MIRAVMVLLASMASGVSAQDLPALYAVSGVAGNDVLNVRADPDGAADIIGTIAPDATGVEVISVADGWAMVNTDERQGYVALRYLVRENGPAWNSLEARLACFGTEPFWSLTIAPADGQLQFATPETETPQITELDKAWPGTLWAPAAAIQLPGGLAVFTPNDCSDGMSERSYGVAVDIFLQGTDRQRLSGCCRLAAP